MELIPKYRAILDALRDDDLFGIAFCHAKSLASSVLKNTLRINQRNRTVLRFESF